MCFRGGGIGGSGWQQHLPYISIGGKWGLKRDQFPSTGLHTVGTEIPCSEHFRNGNSIPLEREGGYCSYNGEFRGEGGLWGTLDRPSLLGGGIVKGAGGLWRLNKIDI